MPSTRAVIAGAAGSLDALQHPCSWLISCSLVHLNQRRADSGLLQTSLRFWNEIAYDNKMDLRVQTSEAGDRMAGMACLLSFLIW